MTIACFISGSGTNYRAIVSGNPEHNYIVFTNRPDCGGTAIARENGHEVIELSHIPYLRQARKRFGPGKVPRNCPERVEYEREVCRLIEGRIGKQPDLICLAGYDQWNTDWMVDRYYPRLLNIHPGDTSKGYDGLHWIPSAKAILAGDEVIRSTLFFVDKGEDTGPVLVQSGPLNIARTLLKIESETNEGLPQKLETVTSFAMADEIKTYDEFKEKAGADLLEMLGDICGRLQDVLKEAGDWEIYPLAVARIAGGNVETDGRTVYLDGKKMPRYGYRVSEIEQGTE
ncbi:MAG: formyltransferase family protein [Dehalococcoidales bacterium]